MNRKKLTIYITIIIIFFTLFILYLWSMFESTETITTQRIQEITKVTETQIQSNLNYMAKELSLFLRANELDEETDIRQLTAKLDKLSTADTTYMLIAADGSTYNASGEKNHWKLDSSAIKWSSSNDFSIISVSSGGTAAPSVAIIVPQNEKSDYFLARTMTSEQFLTMLTDSTAITAETVILFDEWGNLICSNSDQTDQGPVYFSIVKEAVSYCFDRQEYTFHKITGTGKHCFYVSLAQPRGWFIGTNTTASGESSMMGLYSPSILILLGLILVLAAIVTLDIINDRDKKTTIEQISNVDRLTGLHNSLGMQDCFNQFQENHDLSHYHFIYMDIISFSRVNTMFGHNMGDILLCTISDVIRSHAKCGVRVNADHFTFLLGNSENMIADFEESLNHAIEAQLGSEYLQVIAFKFGIYPITTPKASFRDVYEGSLWALKDAKKIPIQNNVVYDNNLKQYMEMQKDIEVNMMHALSKDEFLVYIQPQFDMPGERCTRGETLIRWNSEFMGFLPPDKFIPVFENNGFIVETDFFMLSCALQLLSDRIASGKKPITLAVNQSKVTIAFPNYFERLKSTIEQYCVPLSYIELEITESTLENSWEIIVPLIHNVKRLGFSIAMDDFGSGFSSLNTLRILPIDILKIDKAFLQESDSSERCRTIIKNVVNMAKDLKIKVVCEGVETEGQLNFLKSIGCDIVQGFYYSKPLPAEDFVQTYLEAE